MVFKGTKGPRVSRYKGIEGFHMLTEAFKGVAYPKSNSLRVQGIKSFSGLQGPRVKGIKGSWVPVDPKVLKVPRA